ncbi:MAG: CDP-glycerol glycerophosphotransferase family protein [Kiritimatiellae bacterium]|nr:CDP-glycerol glycerophosphotransferase family protein [Kiritimatiellia bacterium]
MAPRRSYYLMLKSGLPWVPKNGRMAKMLSLRALAVFGTIRPVADIGSEPAGALQVLLWHGMAIKGIGLQGIPKTCHFPEIEFTIATSPFTSEIQQRAFALPASRVICSGEPKTDGLVDADRPDLLQMLGGKYQRIVLYAPTFRDEEFQAPGRENTNLALIDSLVNSAELKAVLLRHNACMVIALHPFVRNLYKKPLEAPFLPAAHLDMCIEYLMAGSSCLISDYSSVIIDWLLLARPMILYCPDMEAYKEQRGFPYFDYKHMLGSFLVPDANSAAAAVDRALSGSGEEPERLKELRDLFHAHPAGGASRRVFDHVLAEVRRRPAVPGSRRFSNAV